MKENKILKKNCFSAKIASGQALFLPLIKAKNQHQNFEKYLKQKICAIRRLNVPNFCYFSKKSGYHGEKSKKLLQIRNFQIFIDFEQFFYVFHHVNLNFFENNKRLEHLNVLLRIFFVSGVF